MLPTSPQLKKKSVRKTLRRVVLLSTRRRQALKKFNCATHLWLKTVTPQDQLNVPLNTPLNVPQGNIKCAFCCSNYINIEKRPYENDLNIYSFDRYEQHDVADDTANCEDIYEEKCEDVTQGYSTTQQCTKWPVKKCRVENGQVKKFSPVTECKKVPFELCGPGACPVEPGPEECREETRTVSY